MHHRKLCDKNDFMNITSQFDYSSKDLWTARDTWGVNMPMVNMASVLPPSAKSAGFCTEMISQVMEG